MTPRDYLTTRLALAEGATGGNWTAPGTLLGLPCTAIFTDAPEPEAINREVVIGIALGANRDFIADARTSSPAMATALLAVLDVLDAEPDSDTGQWGEGRADLAHDLYTAITTALGADT